MGTPTLKPTAVFNVYFCMIKNNNFFFPDHGEFQRQNDSDDHQGNVL